MIVLTTEDVPALREFYERLGWQVLDGATDELSTFAVGEVGLTIYGEPKGPSGQGVEPVRVDEDRAGVTFVVRVANEGALELAFESALSAGGRAISPPKRQPWGGRSAVFADPRGNRWELLWHPTSGARPDRAD